MRGCLVVLLLLRPVQHLSAQNPQPDFWSALAQLEFAKAKQAAAFERDDELRKDMLQLADIMFYAGQTDRAQFNAIEAGRTSDDRTATRVLRNLTAGYLSFFYDPVKGDAFRYFYRAYQAAKESDNDALLRPCLLAILSYYQSEIAQNSDSYQPYLTHLEAIKKDATDQAWLAIYKLVFRSKALNGLTADYFELVTALDQSEQKLDPSSPVLAHIFCEKALSLDIQHKTDEATVYYLRAIQQSRDYPFLKFTRFYCFLKLAMIEAQQRHFDAAQAYLARAEAETNRADTLRSRYHLNLYRSFLLHAKNDNDSAYALLKKAYAQDFQLDFRRNTLEINRLTVELETREKENANLRLQRDRVWLLAGVIVAGFMAVATYLTLVNYKGKAKIQLHQQEVATMKLEKQLKDLELASIDQMLEGQEKERQQIANELHDDLGSLLTTVKLHFDHLKTKTESAVPSDTSGLFQKTGALLDEVYQKVRTLAHVRNTGVNTNEGLLPALRSYAAKVSLANQLVIEIETHGLETRLDNSLEITIFRIIQELITNVIKHAQATEVTVHLTPHDDVLNVMVEDNGRGFDVSQIKRGATMGLYSIQKRIENAGGSVFIDSIPNKGTTVIIDIPLT